MRKRTIRVRRVSLVVQHHHAVAVRRVMMRRGEMNSHMLVCNHAIAIVIQKETKEKMKYRNKDDFPGPVCIFFLSLEECVRETL